VALAPRIPDDVLSASWLAARIAVEPFKLEAMRRAGELVAFQPQGSREWYYPVWQFDEDWRPLPALQQVAREARERGLRGNRLYEVLAARAGISGRKRLGESLREGRVDHVLEAVRLARP
jgi:hypothetical protein